MNHERLLRRCFDLARLGKGLVSPNPMVGAVLVYKDSIIGEGWHQQWGSAHAEVNCIRSVSPHHQHLISQSTLYCSLEPCFHFGKTPPCVDLVIAYKIPRVVLSNIDPNPKVAGQSIAKLRAAGVEVLSGVLEAEGRRLNRAFFTWILEHRPYVILKWAQSCDGFLARPGERTTISSPAALRLVHRWRNEVDAILIGTATAVTDNPRLDTRLFPGKNPLRVVFDMKGGIPTTHHLLDGRIPTWVYTGISHPATSPLAHSGCQPNQPRYIPAAEKVSISGLLSDLIAENRAILLVEGGANVLRQFLAYGGCWDEIRVIENTELRLGGGVAAPEIPFAATQIEKWRLGADEVRIFTNHTILPAIGHIFS